MFFFFLIKSSENNLTGEDKLLLLLLVIIIISCCGFIFVLITVILIIVRLRTQSLDLNLPHNWIWEPSYVSKSGYKKSSTNPIYFWKQIDLLNQKNFSSKEYKLFKHLKGIIEFENLMIKNITLVSCRTLAQNMSNHRNIMKERLISSSAIFNSKNWKEKSNVSLRSKTLDHFERQILNFEWNFNLQLEDCPILAVAHATCLKKATKILVTGFASISIIDKGYYGKGMYFSSSALYTIPYCLYAPDPCIIICFLLPGNPFPVIENPSTSENLIGSPIISGYQSHYIVTSMNGFPSPDENKSRKFNEILIDQESQVVPIFLVELDNSNFAELAQFVKREVIISDKNIHSEPSSGILDYSSMDFLLSDRDPLEILGMEFLVFSLEFSVTSPLV